MDYKLAKEYLCDEENQQYAVVCQYHKYHPGQTALGNCSYCGAVVSCCNYTLCYSCSLKLNKCYICGL